LFHTQPAGQLNVVHAVRVEEGRLILQAGTAVGIAQNAHFVVHSDRNLSQGSNFVAVAKAVQGFLTILSALPGEQLPRLGSSEMWAVPVIEEPGSVKPLVIRNEVGSDEPTSRLANASHIQLHQSPQQPSDMVLRAGSAGYQLEVTPPPYDPFVQNYAVPRSGPIAWTTPLDSVMRGIAHYYWHLRREPQEKSQLVTRNLVTFHMYELRKSIVPGEPPIAPATNDDLVRDGRVTFSNLDDHIPGFSPEIPYGFRIQNNSDLPLHVYMYYFDNSDFSIREWSAISCAASSKLSAIFRSILRYNWSHTIQH
jgi:hypothetical protein